MSTNNQPINHDGAGRQHVPAGAAGTRLREGALADAAHGGGVLRGIPERGRCESIDQSKPRHESSTDPL